MVGPGARRAWTLGSWVFLGCTFPDVTIIQGAGGAGATSSVGAAAGSGGTAAGGAGGGAEVGGGGTGGVGGSGGVPVCGTVESCDLDCDGELAERCGGDDCDDDDDLVFSTQTSWFTSPRKNGGGYDYDCSGEEEQLYPTFLCSQPLGLCATSAFGFLVDAEAQIPVACGATTTYGKCELVSCKTQVQTDVFQACH